MREVVTKLFNFGSQNTYYQWKKQNRPIMRLIEKYFRKEDLLEFLESEKIRKIDEIDNNEILYSIALKKYDDYAYKLIETSIQEYDDLLRYEDNVRNLEQSLFTKVPILSFFEYLFYAKDSDYNYHTFGSDMLSILMEYNIDSKCYISIQELFKVDEELIQIFNLFTEQNSFDLYYKYSRTTSVNLIKDHEKFYRIFANIKDIQSLNLDISKTNQLLEDLIRNQKINI